MEIDTRTAVSIISDSIFSSVFEPANLQETEVKLCTYYGKQLPVKANSLVRSVTMGKPTLYH